MVTGILAAYPEGEFFDDVLLDLQAIADEPVSNGQDHENFKLLQVHALNSLREIFTDSRFGARAVAHIPVSLEIAASCLESPVYVTTFDVRESLQRRLTRA